MPNKKTSKAKQSARKGGSRTGPKPPSLLLPASTSGTTSTSTSMATELEGLPRTPGKDARSELGSSSLPHSVTDTADKAQSTPAIIEPSSQRSASAALIALAATSNRAPSPEPPQTPQSPTAPRHHRAPSVSSSIHSTHTPALIRSSGKGVSFLPSTSLVTTAVEDDSTPIHVAGEKPSWSRRASGTAREAMQEDAKEKEEKTGSGRVYNVASAGTGSSNTQDRSTSALPPMANQDSETERMVEDMVKEGRIRMGKRSVSPSRDSLPRPDSLGIHSPAQTDAIGDEEQGDGAEGKVQGDPPVEHETSAPPRPLPTTVTPMKREHDNQASFLESPAPNASLPKRRIITEKAEDETIMEDESDHETVLNEVRRTGVDYQWQDDTSNDASDPTDPSVYTPPYKVRRPRSATMQSVLEPDQGTAISVHAAITRHSTVPFTSTRRVELRLGWSTLSNLGRIPGWSYLPSWKMGYVSKRSDRRGGIVRRVVRGSLGYVPIFWRLAEWI